MTYGVDYDTHRWPPNPETGRHDGYEQPVFAWVPSIGISNLIAVKKSRFSRWREDLIIASLDGHALWRVRLQGDRAVLTEQIPIGTAIRDVIEGRNGEIVLWCDIGDVLVLEPIPDAPPK